MLLQEHSRRCLGATFWCLLFQASLKFISSCCIFLIIRVNMTMMQFVMEGLRLISGGKQATSVAHKVLRSSYQKAKPLSSTQWRNKNADDGVPEIWAKGQAEEKARQWNPDPWQCILSFVKSFKPFAVLWIWILLDWSEKTILIHRFIYGQMTEP